MLRISDVSYRYKTRKIPTLKHLSLHVQKEKCCFWPVAAVAASLRSLKLSAVF